MAAAENPRSAAGVTTHTERSRLYAADRIPLKDIPRAVVLVRVGRIHHHQRPPDRVGYSVHEVVFQPTGEEFAAYLSAQEIRVPGPVILYKDPQRSVVERTFAATGLHCANVSGADICYWVDAGDGVAYELVLKPVAIAADRRAAETVQQAQEWTWRSAWGIFGALPRMQKWRGQGSGRAGRK